MIRAGFGEATHVFSMLGEGGPFIAEARRRGLVVVSEVYIQLNTLRIVAEECRAFPDWEPQPSLVDIAAIESSARTGMLSQSDYFICPSPAVRDDLVTNWGVEFTRTCVVPYGMDPGWLEIEPRPVRGRVLFVGTADLRKGIHYLAMAAERLAVQGNDLEFRVAGHVTRRIADRPECRRLNFLGRVPRDRIREEFQTADVFVLPSLAEGSAEVTYEALAAGVPVITTKAAGSVIRDGLDGVIVPERDAEALAEAVRGVVGDRRQRDRLAMSARERAVDFTWPQYGERLIEACTRIAFHA
jgi:glycosyltransferase involved in cell wall biosynthesis